MAQLESLIDIALDVLKGHSHNAHRNNAQQQRSRQNEELLVAAILQVVRYTTRSSLMAAIYTKQPHTVFLRLDVGRLLQLFVVFNMYPWNLDHGEFWR